MSLLTHAENEMKLIGLDKKESDYDGMLYEAIMKMIKVFADEGHSGFSAMKTLAIFDTLARFKPLSPLTNDPEEWMEVGEKMWQNKRDSECFSVDGGQTYYKLDDKEVKITSQIMVVKE